MLFLALAACRHGLPDTGDSKPLDTDADADTDTDADSDTDADTDITDPGCDPSGDVSLELVPDGLDPILVFDATVDPDARRAWSTALVTPTLAEIDIDSGDLVKIHSLGDLKLDRPQVSVAGDGAPWVSSGAGHALTRLDPKSGTPSYPLPEMSGATAVVAHQDGGAFVSGDIDGQPVIVRLDRTGAEVARVELDDPAVGMTEANTADVAALLSDDDGVGGQRIVVYNGDTLELLEECDVPQSDKFFTQLADGTFITATETTLGHVTCDGNDPVVAREGQDNKEVFPWNDGFVVLDRTGDDTADGPNWGMVRYYTADLQYTGHSFPTGKHTGYGGLDPSTGTIWANSEGTSEVWAIDLVNEEIDHKVRVGLNIETVLPDPRHPGSAIITGRLSSTVGRADLCDGTFVESDESPTWPVAPVLHGDTLYTIDQLTQTIQVWDAETLTQLESWDLGFDENTLLNFDHLLWHPGRDTLFMTQTVDNILVEIDPADGTILHQWVLAGDPITDTGTISRSEIELIGDSVLVVRPVDGQISVIDPDSDSVETAEMDGKAVKTVDTNRLDLVYVAEDLDRFYVGPIAFSTSTLAPTGDDLTGAVSVFADDGTGGVWAYSFDDQAVLRFDAAGNETDSVTAIVSDQGEPSFHIVPQWDGRLFYSDFEHATLHGAPM